MRVPVRVSVRVKVRARAMARGYGEMARVMARVGAGAAFRPSIDPESVSRPKVCRTYFFFLASHCTMERRFWMPGEEGLGLGLGVGLG